jgi:hypothetical protein
MAEEKPELREILARLENVEGQNRNLKRGGLVAVLLATTMFTMGQANPDRTIEVDIVKAHKIFVDLIQLTDTKDYSSTLIMPGFMTVQTLNGKDLVYISTSEGPSVRLIDKEGFQAALGTSPLVTMKTGETHQTSAASVVLFGKDKKVLWSAP